MLHHSAMPPDDLPERRSVRFHFRGDKDLVDCLVSWDALDRLENHPAATRAERLARFEQHRARIEAAALRKLDAGSGQGELTLATEDVMSETGR
ncbi:DUF1488 domain-containing protein [Starkeya koreensis]|uniref:DUF1488 domain-containing protein n=1 Tax=Ancylobacter koreensis TaxID=266121 RepID=A0ABT0DMN7_9HYPH|nr:DUF1488 family protein [Ancylobacter koreensis]MCK0208397.1 DUF1488 domain-containing protein [Ancylobacter koreensis]